MKVLIVLPVLDEEEQLEASVGVLHRHVRSSCPFPVEIAIADNGSTDRTPEIAGTLARRLDGLRVVRLEERGRGRAVKRCWMESDADILGYMDIDLSTDLEAFVPMIEGIAGGRFDLGTASRLLGRSRVTRSLKREVISRGYNLLVKLAFGTTFSDAQCGFKAISRPAARALLPLVEDTGWFFDTELLVLAERLGYRILDLPARWVEDPGSRVQLWKTALADLRGLRRLRRNFSRGLYPERIRT